jgi:hypothetical protein
MVQRVEERVYRWVHSYYEWYKGLKKGYIDEFSRTMNGTEGRKKGISLGSFVLCMVRRVEGRVY